MVLQVVVPTAKSGSLLQPLESISCQPLCWIGAHIPPHDEWSPFACHQPAAFAERPVGAEFVATPTASVLHYWWSADSNLSILPLSC
jgi:hypothetical protein